jgi:hypothetical protein
VTKHIRPPGRDSLPGYKTPAGEEGMAQYQTMRIRISNALRKQIQVFATREGTSPDDMIRTLLEDALALRVTVNSSPNRSNRPAQEQ